MHGGDVLRGRRLEVGRGDVLRRRAQRADMLERLLVRLVLHRRHGRHLSRLRERRLPNVLEDNRDLSPMHPP
jgi:hypothetical protein